MEITQLLGRLHPLILHLPIGILCIAFLMEWLGRKEKYIALAPATGFAIQIGMWTSIFAAGSGYILSWEGGYDEITLNRHQWLGIGTAVVSIIVYLLYQRKASGLGKLLYFPIFGVLMLLIGITGHIGGSLTHGSDFLTEPFYQNNKNTKVVIENMDSALVFHDLIQPIFKQKCVSCHNESKIKGDLLMTTIAGIQNGGETGAFFKPGDVTNSLFLQRVHLPLEEKEHMPPKGKKQLTEDEVKLLSWWVSEGASFDKVAGAINQPEEIKAILAKYVESDKSVFALNVDPIEENTLLKLRQAGIQVEIVFREKSFVTASLSGRKDLNKNTFKQLRNIAEQLIGLDLSDSNMDDALLPYLKDFPHLQKLFLQKTGVTGKNLNVLNELNYLEYLNLYDTPLNDKALQPIAKFAALQNLYLWRTEVSAKAIQQLKNDRPRLNINTGIDKNIFGEAALKPPTIIIDKDIFSDSATIAFDVKFRGVDLFYTLDGTTPDSTSKIYSEPFVITQTTNIQAIAKKEGWATSPPAQKTVVRATHQIANIKLNKPPNDKYKADGPSSLIDFKKGSTDFADGKWIGYQKSHFTATLDLGKAVDVSSVSVSAMESTGSYIFFPKNLNVALSQDGKKFQPVAQNSIPTASGPMPTSIKYFVLPFDTQNARYIKVAIESNLTNPAWHPAPGASCWTFIDEIMVE